MHILSFVLALFGVASLCADQGKIIKINNGLEIWYETFGQKENPACLLVMGAGGQGIFWTNEICEKLAKKGFYVIRYDNRDTGCSTRLDFAKNPYTLLDMAKDAIGLLDALDIKEVHVVGTSMGGPITELISVHDPKRVKSIALIATSPDFRPLNLSSAGLPPEVGTLSSPAAWFKPAMDEIFKGPPPTTKQELLDQRMALWKLMNGDGKAMDEKKARAMQEKALSRESDPSSFQNHLRAIFSSEDLVRQVPHQVKVPTVIFHGTADPIFGIDHGEALKSAIKGSQFYPIEGMGHILDAFFSDFVIDKITQNAFRV